MSRIKVVLDVVEDMRSLADSLETLAMEIERPEEEEEEKKEEAIYQEEQTKEVEEEMKPQKTYTMEEVRKVLAAKSGDGKIAEVKELLTRHGAAKLSAIDPAEYPAMMEEVQKL